MKILLLLLLLLLFCNFDFIQSTIKVLEIEDHKNEYSGYPDFALGNKCSFKDNRYLFIDSEGNGITGVTLPTFMYYNSIQIESSWAVFSFYTGDASIPRGLQTLDIIVSTATGSSAFQFNFTCNDADYTNARVLPNQETLRLNSDLSYCAPVYVAGIPFNLKYLSFSINGQASQTTGKNNEFCYTIPRQQIEDLSISEYVITVYLGTKQFDIHFGQPLLGFNGIDGYSFTSYPPNSNLATELGLGLSPVLTFIPTTALPLTTNSPYHYLFTNASGIDYIRPIFPSSGSGKYGIHYTVTFTDYVSEQLTNYYIKFIWNGKFVERLFEKTTKVFPLQTIPTIQLGNIRDDPNFPYFEVEFIQTVYNFNLYTFNYGDNSLKMASAPYGFWHGSNSEFTFKVSALRSPGAIGASNSFCSNIFPTQSNCINVPTLNLVTDNQSPKITSYQFIHLIDSIYRLLLSVVDESGVLLIKSDSFLENTNILDALISGDLKNGVYEFICDVNLDTSLMLTDIYQNVVSLIIPDYYISLNSTNDKLLHFSLPDIVKQSFSFKSFYSVSFEKNNLNLTQGNSYNSIYIVGDGIPIDKIMFLELTDPINYDPESKVSKGKWPIKWDNSTKRFIGKFKLQSNTIFGVISYNIHLSPPVLDDSFFETDVISNLQLSEVLGISSQLIVTESTFDNTGPYIDFIETSFENNGNILLVSWNLLISDTTFSIGYIKVMGSIDNSIYHFNFSNSDLSEDYIIKVSVEVTVPCISQDYVIVYVSLVDLAEQESIFEMYTDNPKPSRNALRSNIHLPQYLRSKCTCPTFSLGDTTPPSIVTLTASPSIMNVLDDRENRMAHFLFEVSDMESGIKKSQLPIIYIQDSKMDMIQCVADIEYYKSGEEDKTIGYNCSIEIPYGFGYPGNLIYSIYGLINNFGMFKGYTTNELFTLFNTRAYLDTSITTTAIGLRSSPNTKIMSHHHITSLGGTLVLFGRSFDRISNKIQIQFTDDTKGTIHNYTATFISPKSIVVDRIPATGRNSIIVNILNQQEDQIVDTYSFYPIYFNTTFDPNQVTPLPVETTIPVTTTPPPKTCIGNPECGGKSNGYCNQGINCICYSPWVGIDCTSQVIIIPKPVTNDTNPSTEIPIKTEDGSTTNILFKSLISIVSLRELNFNGDESIKEHTFDKWVLSEINSNKNQYFTSITSNNGISNNDVTTNITVELEWFNSSTVIEFANSNLTMNPSTIKYTVHITEYPFSSNLNHLQLIMSAKFESSETHVCSLNKFGEESIDGDNYLKIQIQDHSLNGRFIKRAILDSKFITVSNKLLDSSLNEITSNQQDKSQSFIGINIPHYQSFVIIDPDFSVLLDSVDASNDEDSICVSSSSKLTSAQLAGIIVGSVGFATVAAVSVGYYFFKKKQNLKFKNNIENKLKNVN